MANKIKPDKVKKIALAVLFLVFLLVFAWQFLSGPAPRPRASRAGAANSNAPRPAATAPPIQTPGQVQSAANQAATQQEYYQQLISNTAPLDLSILRAGAGSPKVSERGNIFAYYVPPPKPPEPPPPPPPITINVVQPQTAVAGTPRPITLTVSGSGFPPDAQILMDGRPKPSKRVNENSLSTEITPEEYAAPRNINIEVKSQTEPAKFWSRAIPFIAQPAPEPQFKYVGRIGERGLFEMPSKEVLRVKAGDTIQGIWRVVAVTDANAELIHTQHEIKKRVSLQDKGRQ